MSAPRVVAPEQPPLGLVLTCGSNACRRTFEPDPVALAAGSLACPGCGGWVFSAELVEPAAAGGGS